MNVCIPSCEMCYTFRSMSLSLARSVRLVSLVAFSLVWAIISPSCYGRLWLVFAWGSKRHASFVICGLQSLNLVHFTCPLSMYTLQLQARHAITSYTCCTRGK